ncbi:MAG: NAD-dependent epimerase/dehydratase family protein [Myxococcota bacterium]
MRALVTGAAGFAGRHLVAHLRARGDDVVEAGHACEESVDFRIAEDVAALTRRASPEVVFHLAGTSDPAEFARDVASAHLNVVQPAVNLLEALAFHGKGARLVLVTGWQVYGRPPRLPLDETCPVQPADLFGTAKGAVEFIARGYRQRGVDYVVARPFHHLGPGRRPLSGDPAARRDLTDVRDVVAGYVLLAERGVAGEAYNLCSGRAVALADVPHVPAPSKEPPVLLGSPAKAEALGWVRRFALEETLASL